MVLHPSLHFDSCRRGPNSPIPLQEPFSDLNHTIRPFVYPTPPSSGNKIKTKRQEQRLTPFGKLKTLRV